MRVWSPGAADVGMGDAVVLQDDALLHLLKEPADGAAHPLAAALVHIGVEALDTTGPVDLLFDHLAGGGYLLGFAGAFGVGAVAGHEQPRWGYGPDGVNHLAQGVGRRQAMRRRGVSAGFTGAGGRWRAGLAMQGARERRGAQIQNACQRAQGLSCQGAASQRLKAGSSEGLIKPPWGLTVTSPSTGPDGVS